MFFSLSLEEIFLDAYKVSMFQRSSSLFLKFTMSNEELTFPHCGKRAVIFIHIQLKRIYLGSFF